LLELVTALKELEIRHGAYISTVLLGGWAAWRKGGPGRNRPGPEASPHHLLAVIDELSEEELDRLLGAQP
jgi:hypothetical protein